MTALKFAIFGTGFWSRFQLAGWQELAGAECVALYNRTRGKAEALAAEFHVPAVYDNPEELLEREQLDFVDIITDVGTHSRFVHMAADRGLAVICQKPMAPSLAEAEEMVEYCRTKGVPLYIHENWRWQHPIRQFYSILQSGIIGTPFRGRIRMVSGFPVFANQPFLKELDQFVLTDIGSHILDVARLLFGEASHLYCQTHQVHRDIRGEDVATVMMKMGGQTTVLCELGYAENPLEIDRFPETFIFVEGDKGSLELAPDFWIRTTTENGTHARRYAPPRYPWADPAYDVAHSSIVQCNADILQALRGAGDAETTAVDNIKTVRLYYSAYDSAERGETIIFPEHLHA